MRAGSTRSDRRLGGKARTGLLALMLVAASLFLWSSAWAITIVSGPTFTPATNAPLAGLLELTTDVSSRISVLVSEGTNTWERDFYDYGTNHSVPLLGFRPGHTNEILVTVVDPLRNTYTAPQVLSFITDPLPTNFPTANVLVSQPSMMEPGYMLFMVGHSYVPGAYLVIIDNSGNVVWYTPVPAADPQDVRQLDDGNLFMQESGSANNFIEMNMLGQIVQTWAAPAGYPVNIHEGVMTSHGTILYLSDVRETVTNFPANDTNSSPPLETVSVDDNPVVEISVTNSALLNVWSPLSFIDPTRVTYLTYGEYSGSPVGLDSEHANSIIDDTNDDSIIVSMRNQNAVMKFSRATGGLKWILGPHELWGAAWQPYLLTPVGAPIDWNYGQHAPYLTPQGTLIVYNDDNYAASPFDPPVPDANNISDAVEYSIDETNLEVSEVWNSAWQTNQDRLYTPFIGRVQWLPQTRNVLVDYGAVTYVNGVHPSLYATNALMVRLKQYTHDPVPQVVFDLAFFDYGNTNANYTGYNCYRAYQIPDLYTHPVAPVTDLALQVLGQIPHLQFSGDPARSYYVQSSTDLVHWTTIGEPEEDGGPGDYDFDDLQSNASGNCFYRVVAQ